MHEASGEDFADRAIDSSMHANAKPLAWHQASFVIIFSRQEQAMVTRQEARRLVEEYLASHLPALEDDVRVVWEEMTEDHEGCWVCFWVRRKYLETRDEQHQVGGNYPIIVDKIDGTLYGTGFRDVDEYVHFFQTGKASLKRLM